MLAVPILVLRLENLDSVQFTVLLSVQMLQEDTDDLALHHSPCLAPHGALSSSRGVAAATTVAPCFAVTGAFITSDSDPSPARLPPENFTVP